MTEPNEAVPAVITQPERLPRERAPQTDRFRVALAALAGIAVAAIAIAAAIASRAGSTSGPSVAWSAWSPNSTTQSVVQQEIADRIAPFYRLTGSKQLDVITPIQLSNPSSAGVLSGTGLTVAINTATSSSSGQSLGLLNGTTVAYNLCGTGSAANCSLAGTPSQARMLLMRREALELSLYTLRYMPGDTNVVVVLPPGHTASTSSTGSTTSTTSTAGASTTASPMTVSVLFDRAELQPWLQVPLSQTLTPYPPMASQAATWSSSQEATFVSQITSRSLFSTQIQSPQTGGKLLVMTPLPPQ